jgi:solute carrier family 35 protein E1
MNNRVGKNLTAMNLYAILTILATIILFPIAAWKEGPIWVSTFQRLYDSNQLSSYIIQSLCAAISYYTYNEVSFMALDNIDALSHALASTLRRVFIITSSMVVFGNKMTSLGIVGTILAVGGTLLYSATKQRFRKKRAV